MKAALAAALAGAWLAVPGTGVALSSAPVRLLRTASLVRQAPTEPPPAVVGAGFDEQDCLEVPSTVCLTDDAGRVYVHGKLHAPRDLQLWFQFDKSLPVDDSGNVRNLVDAQSALTPLAAGPGILGRGASGSFDGKSYRMVRAPEAFVSQSFTVTLWLFLREDSNGSWRTIFSRGSRPEELRPALLLAPNERRLHVRASPRAEAPGGALDASGLLPLRRWTHVAVVCTGGVLRLYVNGIKDGELILEEPLGDSDAPLYLGRDPWRAGAKAFVDDFRWYSREVGPDELRAMLYPSLTGIVAPDSIFLGCSSCRFPEAVKACSERRSILCSLQDLYAGGYHTARAMGWLTASSDVWRREDVVEEAFQPVKKLGICCTD